MNYETALAANSRSNLATVRKNKQIKEKKITKKERMPCNPLDSSMAEDTFSFTFSGGLNNLGRP